MINKMPLQKSGQKIPQWIIYWSKDSTESRATAV